MSCPRSDSRGDVPSPDSSRACTDCSFLAVPGRDARPGWLQVCVRFGMGVVACPPATPPPPSHTVSTCPTENLNTRKYQSHRHTGEYPSHRHAEQLNLRLCEEKRASKRSATLSVLHRKHSRSGA